MLCRWQVLRKSIEKAGENIKILRQMLETEKQKSRDMQQRLDANSQGVQADHKQSDIAEANIAGIVP